LPFLAFAGGPLTIGGPQFGIDGQAFKFDLSQGPIQYRVDGGPLSSRVNNATGLTRVQAAFSNWSSVPTTNLSFQYAGAIQATGAFTGGDVKTISDFNAVVGACQSGAQSPIIFDADGSLLTALGMDSAVIGFGSPCKLDPSSGHILSALATLNGVFQDGVNTYTNYEATANQFDEVITHEIGHFLGLGHSQINQQVYNTPSACSNDVLAGLPLMFPQEVCPARKDSGLPILSPDDAAWISYIYPNAKFNTTYGLIKGFIYFGDSKTSAQGVNIIARAVDDPTTPQDESRRTAFSAVSGLYFTGNPGQTVTGDNPGSHFGSHQGTLVGYYEIPVLAGTYTVEVESVNSAFTGGSSVGPLDPPIPMPGAPEFWDQYESAFDYPTDSDTIDVSAGQSVTNINIILNATFPRFDSNEDSGLTLLLNPNLALHGEHA
jgi:Matrixin